MTIKEYREQKGLTQRQLAKELAPIFKGVDTSLISKFEHGVCVPPVELQAYIDKAGKPTMPELTDTQERIYQILKASEEPVTRVSLCFFIQQSDRENRADIADMRKKGIRICSSSHAKGYWLAKGQEDYQTLRNEYIARISNMASVVRAMDNYIEGQVRM